MLNLEACLSWDEALWPVAGLLAVSSDVFTPWPKLGGIKEAGFPRVPGFSQVFSFPVLVFLQELCPISSFLHIYSFSVHLYLYFLILT